MNNLIRFRPAGIRSFQDEFERLFDGFLPDRADESSDAMWTPRVDLSETEEAYKVEVDVPGVKGEDINISYNDHVLTVSGERSNESKESKKGEYVRIERSYGKFYRSFRLPKAIDADKIEARHDNGVLLVTVPKAEESKPRKINVSSSVHAEVSSN
jgi:HSP20 family protein